MRLVITHIDSIVKCRTLWNENISAFPKENTVFPHIDSAETILFWLWPYVLWPLISVHKCAETIQGQKLYEEIRYLFFSYLIATKSSTYNLSTYQLRSLFRKKENLKSLKEMDFVQWQCRHGLEKWWRRYDTKPLENRDPFKIWCQPWCICDRLNQGI